MCLMLEDRVLTGDTLLIGATGRTDLPTGDPEQLFDSIFDGLLHLGDDVLVYPAHDYKGRESSTIGRERAENPLAAATLKEMGFDRAVALDGGFKAWRESDFPVTEGDS